MPEPFLGQIAIVSFNYAPKGWALCNGQLLPINQNQALFALLGTNYGGNGQTTFALPDLRGRHPMGVMDGQEQGERGGEQAHTLTIAEMPMHSHVVQVASKATGTTPGGSLLASPGKPAFAQQSDATMHADAVSNAGGSQAHPNRPPFLALNYVIALQGIFPSQN